MVSVISVTLKNTNLLFSEEKEENPEEFDAMSVRLPEMMKDTMNAIDNSDENEEDDE